MTGGVVRCGHCSTANRVPAAAELARDLAGKVKLVKVNVG